MHAKWGERGRQRRRRVRRFKGGPGEFVISGCLDPTPLYEKNSYRIFTFRMHPTGQLGGRVQTPGPPLPGQLRHWAVGAEGAKAKIFCTPSYLEPPLAIASLAYFMATTANSH